MINLVTGVATRGIPERTVEIIPTVVKTLSDGTPVIWYYWEGAEIAMINSKGNNFDRWPSGGGSTDGGVWPK